MNSFWSCPYLYFCSSNKVAEGSSQPGGSPKVHALLGTANNDSMDMSEKQWEALKAPWQQGQMQQIREWMGDDCLKTPPGHSSVQAYPVWPSTTQRSPDYCTCSRRRSCWAASRQHCAEANWPSYDLRQKFYKQHSPQSYTTMTHLLNAVHPENWRTAVELSLHYNKDLIECPPHGYLQLSARVLNLKGFL